LTVCAKDTFAFDAPNGAQVVVRRGQVFPDEHPYVKGREQLFEPVEVTAARAVGATGAAAAVETATAAPAQRRVVTRTRQPESEGDGSDA
jgi:hypothetical protein